MEQLIGQVTHYFTKLQVAAIKITAGSLKVGETVHIKGATSDFTQKVDSMQIDLKEVSQAKVGEAIGIKVSSPVREHDQVYKVVEE